MSFFKDNNIESEFFDLKKFAPDSVLIQSWVDRCDIDLLLNSKGATYRNLKLKELNLDVNAKYEWLCKEPMLLKRPLIDFDDKIIVAFNEDLYKETFL